MEEWRDVPGYEGSYQVSDHGNIRSVDRTDARGRKLKSKTLRQCKVCGYMTVSLSIDGKIKQFKVHRLVAMAFIPNNGNLPQVNHINENKNDNRASNLEWCTAKQNDNHGTRNARISKKKFNRSDQCKMVRQIKGGVTVAVYPSRNEAARQTGFLKSAIGNAAGGRTKTAYGYEWQYIEGNGANG